MALFALTYDLIKKKDYPELINELNRLKAHRAALSFWLLDVNLDTAVQVRDHFTKFIDKDDRLIVINLTLRPATYNAMAGTKEWLDQRIR